MDRNRRIQIATETSDILKQQSYDAVDPETNEEIVIDLSEVLDDACRGTVFHLSSETLDCPPVEAFETNVYMTQETTLQCLERLSEEGKEEVFVLNFASAKNPGGGLHRGSWEQEENLAAASGLVSCLETQQAKVFYDTHNQQTRPGKGKPLLYTSNMIYSPSVPVFRSDDMELLWQPVLCNVISACCVNYNTGMFNKQLSKEDEETALHLMQSRVLRVLQVAAHHGAETLLVGPWGCGINKNSPKQVAKAFSAAMLHPAMEGRFKEVVFAVPYATDSPVYKYFSKSFRVES